MDVVGSLEMIIINLHIVVIMRDLSQEREYGFQKMKKLTIRMDVKNREKHIFPYLSFHIFYRLLMRHACIITVPIQDK
jgi:hypothetical protein